MSKFVLGSLVLLTVFSFITLSAIVDEFPWTEDFADADISLNWPLPEWDRAEGLLEENTVMVWDAFGWSPDDFTNITNPENISARINIYGTGRLHWLVTPTIVLDDYSDYFLSFDYALTQYGNNNPGNLGNDDKFCVVVSPDNGETWGSNDIILQFGSMNNIPNTSQNIEIPLDEFTGMIRIGFYGQSLVANEDVDFFVDNVHIRMEEFIPEAPQNLTYNILENDVELNWNSPESMDPDSYNIYLDGEVLTNIDATETTYFIADFPIYETEVYVTAIYSELESAPSNSVIITLVDSEDDEIPGKTELKIYPNPISFNSSFRTSSTTISFNLDSDGQVDLSIYNIKGQKVGNLINGYLEKGEYSVEWHGKIKSGNPTPGIYLMKLDIAGNVLSKKITILP